MKSDLRNQTCCFTGHRILPGIEYPYIKTRLEDEIKNLISVGVKYFGTGGALGFDTLAALTVLKMKKEFPYIKLILVLPCENQTMKWRNKDIEIYNAIMLKADKITYVSKKYINGCMHLRNRHLVDCSSFCICYFTGKKGGTSYTVDYAEKKKLKIINIKQCSS